MITDGELLRRYAETNSESAFTELVERHLALVYSAALRQVNGDAHLAQDVVQTVFADPRREGRFPCEPSGPEGLALHQHAFHRSQSGAHGAAPPNP